MPLTETSVVSRQHRYPLREERGGGGGGTGSQRSSTRHPLPPRPHSTSFSTPFPMDLPPSPLSPSSHHPFTSPLLPLSAGSANPGAPSSPSRWGSGSLGSPLGGEGVDGGGLPGGRSSGEGHCRLPSTDSGIQADAGWDSLSRSNRGSLTRVSAESPSSPDCRTPLRTLTRCLMEPRPVSNRCSWGDESPSTRPLSASLRTMTSHSDVRMTSDPEVRSRTCDVDVKGPRDAVPSRMISSFPSGRTRTVSIEMMGKAPTTKGEELEERRGCGWRRGDSVMSRSMDSALPTCAIPVPVSSIGSGSIASRRQRESLGSESSGTRCVPRPDSITSHLDARSDHGSTAPELLGSRSSHITSRSDQRGLGRGVGVQNSSASAYKPSGSSAVSTVLPADQLTGRRVSSDSRPTPSISLLSSSTPVIPSRSVPDSGVGSPQGADGGMGRREVFSDRRSSSQPHDGSYSGTRLQRFQLAYPRVGTTARPGLKASSDSPDRDGSGVHHQDGQARFGAGHHLRPRVTPLSVTHLMNSETGALNRTRHVQVVQRPMGSTDTASSKDLESGVTRKGSSPTSSQSSHSSHISSASRGSPANSRTSPQGSQHVIKVSALRSSSPVRPQFSVIPVAQLVQPDPSNQAHPAPSSSPQQTSSRSSGSASPTAQHLTSAIPTPTSRSRHITPVFRSKFSPVLPRNMLRARIPLSHSPSSSSSPSSSPGRPIPVMHVDTCRAWLKTPTSAPSPLDVTVSGQSQDRPVHTTTTNSSRTVTQTAASSPDDLKVNGSLPTLPPETVLKLLEKPVEGEGAVEKNTPVLEVDQKMPWKERKSRMDTALTWLKGELESLRAMDTTLMTQFRRCQDTIESLKQQQLELAWGDWEGSEWGWGLDGSELDEEEDAWEDWEIAEFERRWAEDPDARELEITVESVTSQPTTDVITNDVKSPAMTSEEGKKSPSPIKQDVEATL